MLLFSELLIKGLIRKMESIIVTYKLYVRVVWKDLSGKG